MIDLVEGNFLEGPGLKILLVEAFHIHCAPLLVCFIAVIIIYFQLNNCEMKKYLVQLLSS